MTIEMENEMNKDEIEAAIIFINDKFNQDYIETEEYYHIFKYHGDTIRAALQSALDTVKKDENIKVSDGQVDPVNVPAPQVKAETVRIYKNMIEAYRE